MELYWTCTDCGSVNEYPGNTKCDACGKPIEAIEIAKAEESRKNAEREIAEQEKQRLIEERNRIKREEERRKKIEAEKRQAELKQRQIERAAQIENIEKKLSGIMNKSADIFKPVKIVLCVLTVLSFALTVFLANIDTSCNDVDEIGRNIEYVLENSVNKFASAHFTADEEFIPFKNIEDRFESVEDVFDNLDLEDKILNVIEEII